MVDSFQLRQWLADFSLTRTDDNFYGVNYCGRQETKFATLTEAAAYIRANKPQNIPLPQGAYINFVQIDQHQQGNTQKWVPIIGLR